MPVTRGYTRRGGPVPKFREYHIWKTLWCLNQEQPLGRKVISSRLNVGEGSTRTIISILLDLGLILVRKNGVMLSPKGKALWEDLKIEVSPIEDNSITIARCNCAVKIPDMSLRITDGSNERDIAIKAGAVGATTLIVEGGSLVFPKSNYPVSRRMQELLKSKFVLDEGDVIVIGTADTEQAAEEGAVTVALDLVDGLNIGDDDTDAPQSMNPNELLGFAFMVHDLVGGLPTCAKPRDGLGFRIEDGKVIDNAYTGEVMEQVIEMGTTIRRIATSGPYKGIRVIVSPVDIDNQVVASIGVVDIRSMAGINNPIRLHEDE